MNLIIDIGNTRTKLAVFENDIIAYQTTVDQLDVEKLEKLKTEYPDMSQVILSSVKDYDADIKNYLKNTFSLFIEFDHKTPTPITNLYKTPETLGFDRLAAAIGAASLMPNRNLLVIDAGTAITYELVTDKNEYLGGNISPGLESRFRALHQFTGKLPLISQSDEFLTIGNDTESAIRSGVQMGLLFEVEQYIHFFSNKYKDIVVFITGGDIKFFDKKLKNSIFVNSNLTLVGLNEILKYNGK